jgi:type IV pilus assembly protein PilP
MGRNHGRIVAVFDDRIEVLELVSDGAGGWSERDAALVLDEQ